MRKAYFLRRMSATEILGVLLLKNIAILKLLRIMLHLKMETFKQSFRSLVVTSFDSYNIGELRTDSNFAENDRFFYFTRFK